MAGYRSKTFSMINGIAARIPLTPLLKLTGESLILPVYHVVSDEEIPHIKHLYKTKNLTAFRADLDFLLRNFQPIDFKMLLGHLDGTQRLEKPSFFLSFDDGLAEFHSIIAPLLLAKGIPAINFLNTAFIDNRDLFFRYKISLLIDQMPTDSGQNFEKEIADILGTKNATKEVIKTALLNLNYGDSGTIDRIAGILQFDFKKYLLEKKPYLTGEQITELIGQGFTFGAHSIDHPLYRNLSLVDQIRQTEVSVTELQKKFQLDYRSFAFPFTDYKVSREFFDHFYNVKNHLDASFGSAGLKRDIYSRHLQRIPMEMGDMTAKQILHSEYLYYFLKFFVGKNRIRRS